MKIVMVVSYTKDQIRTGKSDQSPAFPQPHFDPNHCHEAGVDLSLSISLLTELDLKEFPY